MRPFTFNSKPLALRLVLQRLFTALAFGLWAGLCWGQVNAAASPAAPSVVVVLAGGGAKGFAHLAVLRQLERDRIPIARIVGTSMGAVIGGLYASGMSTDDIERMVGGLDPSKVALDQLNRLELPSRTRVYQQKYPVELEFGIKDGGVSFARGVSDGQRFLALLQALTVHVPPNVHFNDLKIPFRAVATRYRDGEMKVFDRGALHLAIRASMAAPAVFAPVDVDGETYVDGGLVANLPIEVALREGADVIVASFLGAQGEDDKPVQASHALVVANRMLDILIRQNEKRNLALLRPQDVLIQPAVQDIGFADFNRATEIVQRGQKALAPVQDRLMALRANWSGQASVASPLSFVPQEKRIVAIEAQGHKDVPLIYIQTMLAPMLAQAFSAQQAERHMDELYTSGYFDMVSYSLEPLEGDRYTLVVRVREKPYSPHFFKTTLGFSTEVDGVTQFTVGAGYRRPWLTPSGLEFSLDARLGTQSELAARLHQPLSRGWSVEAGASWDRNYLPLYRSALFRDEQNNQKLAYFSQTVQSLDTQLVYDFERKANIKMGLTSSAIRRTFDTTIDWADLQLPITDVVKYKGLKAQFQVDQLDSLSFPTRGYFWGGSLEQGVDGAIYRGGRLTAKWAHSEGPHIVNLGMTVAQDRVTRDCDSCRSPSQLILGGFQNMGSYRMGQLAGDQLAHLQTTYMYRLTDGGLFNQRTYVGTVLEAGDAWYRGDSLRWHYSGTLFVAVDSKIGDIYLGAARGSGKSYNVFLQLGRRFSY